MSSYELGDIVVLTSGSMRMAVEATDGDSIACVWCNEGEIGRDNFNAKLLKKWEYREDTRSAGGDRGGKPPYRPGGGGGDRDDRGPRKSFGGDRDNRGDSRGGDDKPRGKTGWDGKPREKKYFRKED